MAKKAGLVVPQLPSGGSLEERVRQLENSLRQVRTAFMAANATVPFLSPTANPVSGQIIQWDGSEWQPVGLDHGSDLSGLGDDDHTQYSLVDGSRAFTGEVAGVTPTASASLATKGYVDGLVVTLPEWSEYLDASQFRVYDSGGGTLVRANPSVSGGADYTTTYTYYNFADGSTARVLLRTALPQDFDAATGFGLRLRFVISGTPGTSDDVVMQVYWRLTTNSEHITSGGTAAESEFVVPVGKDETYANSDLVIYDTGILTTAGAAGDTVHLIVGRKGADGNDSYTGAVRFMGAELYGAFA